MTQTRKGITQTTETLKHFSCGDCNKWWSIGDAPKGKDKWFCPWCGKQQSVIKKKN